MGNVFGSSKHPKQKITDTDRAVLKLKTQRRQLNAQRTRVEGLIAREIEIAKELIAAKKRERALLALRKKKLREGQLEQIDAYLLNVEQVLANIESAQRQNRLYDALKQGNTALAALQQEVSLEEVERLTEDSAEAKEYEERVRTLLGEALTAEDDAAVLQELSQLEKAEEAEEAAQLPRVPKVEPVTPEAPALTEEEKAQLAELPAVPKTRPEPSQLPKQAAKAQKEAALEEPLTA
ncbi:hypothetical protein WJX75_006433 [Coccomyxa subellipsoidea]|uniref:Snf7-domain-containing protein n=1 Tax=Coccomyxa subellipsoidea TaxID=248742 RepID=A0ABR2YE23_9CHLO